MSETLTYSPIYCENLWIDTPEKNDLPEPSVKKIDNLKTGTKYDRRYGIEGSSIIGSIKDIEPFIANLSEIQSADSFGCIDKIHGLSENDYYYHNEIIEDNEYEGFDRNKVKNNVIDAIERCHHKFQ